MVKVTFANILLQYMTLLIITYFQTKLYKSVGQLTVAKESLKVIVNQLNEAIILKTEDGNIGYCNKLGISIIRPIARNYFRSESLLGKFLQRLSSMDYLLYISSKGRKMTEV